MDARIGQWKIPLNNILAGTHKNYEIILLDEDIGMLGDGHLKSTHEAPKVARVCSPID
jgi:hypothetical protein